MKVLNDRKRLVLKAVVDGYVKTSEPVGSKRIVDQCNLGVSAATVRNILADLEQKGYLIQPHVSAGRVPSDKGYRAYVDHLMTPSLLPAGNRRRVESALAEEPSESEALLRRAVKLLSELTGYTAIAFFPGAFEQRLEGLELLQLEGDRVLLLLLLAGGPARHHLVKLGFEVTELELSRTTAAFGKTFYGRMTGAVQLAEVEEVFKCELSSPQLAAHLGRLVYRMIREANEDQSFVEGLTNLFMTQDLHQPDESGAVASLFEQASDRLLDQLQVRAPSEGVTIRIGQELMPEALHNCSLITAAYQGKNSSGSIGIVGPKRMPYGRVSGSLSYIRNALNHRLQEDLL